MTLFEIIDIAENDFDTYDTEYDVCVTVCNIGKETDNCEKFCNNIMKKVKFVKKGAYHSLIVDWSGLIKHNIDKFRAFTKENWLENCQYEDDEDEFIYQWIKEIHHYIAGYVSESFYKKLVEFVDSLEFMEE